MILLRWNSKTKTKKIASIKYASFINLIQNHLLMIPKNYVPAVLFNTIYKITAFTASKFIFSKATMESNGFYVNNARDGSTVSVLIMIQLIIVLLCA
jgi:hypothetical protein